MSALSMEKLSPQRWGIVRNILSGENNSLVSKSAAAKAAGVTKRDIDNWIERSKERNTEDEPWVWLIAEDAKEFNSSQANCLEDALWDRANNGDRKFKANKEGELQLTERSDNNNVLMRALTKRDKTYSDKADNNVNISFNMVELYEKLKHTFVANKVIALASGEEEPLQLEDNKAIDIEVNIEESDDLGSQL